MEANRNYKDSVFSCFFSDPKRLVEVYNAIEDTNYPLDTNVQINTLEQVLYRGIANDLSFILGNKNKELVVLIEHQSTINPNMALRLLMYAGRLYEKILSSDKDKVYLSTAMKIPTPKFIVLCNDRKMEEKHVRLKLSDMFTNAESTPALELIVNVYNINYDKNYDFVTKSKSLGDYSYLVARIRYYLDQGKPLESAILDAIKDCIENGVMKEFLEQHGSEVLNMLYSEWKWEKANEVTAKEHEAIGEARGKAQGIAIGEARGKAQGIAIGKAQGVTQGNEQALTIFRFLSKMGKLSDFETIISDEERKENILKQAFSEKE